MTQQDFERKLDELDRLLNDPDVRLEPSRVWSLLAEVSQHDRARYQMAMR
jgi:hypothetical protein